MEKRIYESVNKYSQAPTQHEVFARDLQCRLVLTALQRHGEETALKLMEEYHIPLL